jgi:uroporphyrinogen-III synthase
MKGQTVAILESRMGSQLADLVSRHGGRPLLAPSLAELPDVDEAFIARFVADLERSPAKAAIFQTGVGTRALFAATDKLGLSARLQALLASMVVVARGPKPTGVLRSRAVRIDLSAGEPFTTDEVLGALKGVALADARVIVQRYGASNARLEAALEAEGARVQEIPTYRWALPPDTGPMERLIEALARGEVAAAVFTNAMQAHNLFEVAARAGREASLKADLNRTLVASIGPVCSAALKEHGVGIGLEPHPPKLGPLIEALDARLSA